MSFSTATLSQNSLPQFEWWRNLPPDPEKYSFSPQNLHGRSTKARRNYLSTTVPGLDSARETSCQASPALRSPGNDLGLLLQHRLRMPWYPAPNLDRALAPSLVGRFSCLTKELVTRLNFGSASGQAAEPLLRLVIRCSPSCSGSSPSLHPTSVPFWGPRCYWLPMPCPHLPSLMNFVNSTRRSLVARFRTPRGPKTGPPTRIGLPMAH
jgi:hypothetical protein